MSAGPPPLKPCGAAVSAPLPAALPCPKLPPDASGLCPGNLLPAPLPSADTAASLAGIPRLPIQPAMPTHAKSEAPPAEGKDTSAGTALPEQLFAEGESLAFDLSVPFVSALASLPRRVLRCNTKFSRFLRATFCLQRSSLPASSSALFPLPVPFPGVFGGSGPKLAQKRCKSLMIKRGIHVIAMCLNYVFCGGKWTPPAELRRSPSSLQLAAFDRVRRFLSACGSQAPQFPLCPGRRSQELIACVRSLAHYAAQHGPPSSELHPYSNLDADRLKISGNANFWPLPFLQPNLILPFLEPKVLRFRGGEPDEPHPSRCTDPAWQLERLFRKWDQLGLLSFFDDNYESWQKVRVFNARKSETCDRQIADRRSLNLLERRLLPNSLLGLPSAAL